MHNIPPPTRRKIGNKCVPLGFKIKGNMLLASIIGILFGSIFILLYTVTIIGLILVIIAENRNPLKTIPWVVVLLLAPGVGLIFYFFFGQDNRKQRIIKRRTYKRLVSHPKTGKIPADACHVPEPYRELSILLNRKRCFRPGSPV